MEVIDSVIEKVNRNDIQLVRRIVTKENTSEKVIYGVKIEGLAGRAFICCGSQESARQIMMLLSDEDCYQAL